MSVPEVKRKYPRLNNYPHDCTKEELIEYLEELIEWCQEHEK